MRAHPQEKPQQVSRSWAEMWGFWAPLEAMQMRSVMASTAPKAQHEPQAAWSRTSLVDGQIEPHSGAA